MTTFTATALVLFTVITVVLLFVLKWKPESKTWCVMLYYVARDGDPTTNYLDPKLDQVLAKLDTLPCKTNSGEKAKPSWKNVHVVYRAVWDDPNRKPSARVLHWRPFAPKTDYFLGETPPIPGDLTQDLHAFFQWAYDNCKADNYALFFWGHSFGPGGLFSPSSPPVVDPPPSLVPTGVGLDQIALATATQRIVEWRNRDRRLLPERSASGASGSVPGGASSSSGTGLPSSTAVLPPKVEIVFFQDCWMSTLETAYSLESSARYLVASQSLVPVGLDSQNNPNATAIWPYEAIIDKLLNSSSYAADALGELKTYFNAGADTLYPNPTVPFTLLDLGVGTTDVSAAVTGPVQQLVLALFPLGIVDRSRLIEQPGLASGRLFTYQQGVLRAGDVALVDVLKLCGYLKTQTSVGTLGQRQTIALAAGALESALRGTSTTPAIVVSTFESSTLPQDLLNFEGISVLYKPDWFPLGDPALMMHVVKDFYDGLPFAIASKAPLQATCWAKYAFEQPLEQEPPC